MKTPERIELIITAEDIANARDYLSITDCALGTAAKRLGHDMSFGGFNATLYDGNELVSMIPNRPITLESLWDRAHARYFPSLAGQSFVFTPETVQPATA